MVIASPAAATGASAAAKVRYGMCEKDSDHHVLRIPRDGGNAADVGGHGDGEQVGHRPAPQPPGDLEHQRGEHQAHGVVDEESGEDAGHQHDAGEQHERCVRMLHHPGADQREETGEPQIGDHDHHAEQQDDGVVVNGCVGLLHGEDIEGQHQARAYNRRAGAVEPQSG